MSDDRRAGISPIAPLLPILMFMMLLPVLIGAHGADDAVPPSPAPVVVTTTTEPAVLPAASAHSAAWWARLRDYAEHVHAAQMFDAWSRWVHALPTEHVTPVRHVTLRVEDARLAVDDQRCGGDLPPCYVMERESGGNAYAVEPGHQGAPYGDPGDPWHHASGKWQIMPATWSGFMGYPYAAAAPVAVQDAKARELWAGGAGCSQWETCVG